MSPALQVPSIGFVILVNPFSPLEQTERLIRKLTAMFGEPPIAVHQDFGKNPHELRNMPPNVRVVRPHVDTQWADFSCLEAALAALRLLYSGPDAPDWWVYLSGADYPIKPARQILADLAASPYDAHIQHLPLIYNSYPTWWEKVSFERVCSLPITIPSLDRRLQPKKRIFRVSHPWLTRGRLPFSDTFKPYAGEAWFCANRRAAEALLNFYDTDVAVAAHYRRILVPEESYFHTVLANTPGLRLSQDFLRYVDWSPGGSHPKVLDLQDLPKIQASHAHFGRKFAPDPDSPILAALDELTA